MSSKKRSSGGRKAHRQGLSGNPQRRAGQLAQDRRAGRDLSAVRHPQTDPERAAFRELAYRFAGGALPEAWWRESHERILALARALTWPARLVDRETQPARSSVTSSTIACARREPVFIPPSGCAHSLRRPGRRCAQR